MSGWCRDEGNVVSIWVTVRTGARHTELVGFESDRLVVKLAARPIDGAANRELCRFIAEVVGVSRRSVSVQSGARAKHKRLSIEGAELTVLEQTIARRVAG